MTRRWLLLTAVALASVSTVAAAPSAKDRFRPRALAPEEVQALARDGSLLILQGAAFDPTRQEPDYALVGLPDTYDSAYGIVQFHADRVTEKEALARVGVELLGYLPDNAFQVRLTREAHALLTGHPAVRWLGPYRAGYKIHPDLWPGSGVPVEAVTAHLFPGVDPAPIVSAIAARVPDAPRLLQSDLGAGKLRFAVPPTKQKQLVAELSTLSGVAFLERFVQPQLLNRDALGPIQSNVATAPAAPATTCTSCTLFGRDITGAGQIAAVADSGNDSDSCYFRYDATLSAVTDAQSPIPPALGTLEPGKKTIAYYVQPGATAYDNNVSCAGGPATGFHGTHTSGTVVGDNFANLSSPTAEGIDTGDGMAPNAKLVYQDVGNDVNGCLSGLSDPYSMFQQALLAGARVHSNSYGSANGGEYSADDQTVDRFLFDHDEMSIFFSAGNSGSGANTTGSPGNAKNVVTVGALGHGDSTTIASFSSRGPTDDGRLKPDIVAPGSATISASGDVSHTSNTCVSKSLSGTSMSCPTVAGGAVLLRQYLADGWYPSGAPSAADKLEAHGPLVKALLLNGALPLPVGSFGTNTFGWGRIFLDNNLFFAGDTRRLRFWNVHRTDGLTVGQSHSYQIQVGAAQEVRVTLTWFDPEATPGAGLALVNNLNLTVTDGVSTWLGNVITAGISTTGGTADALNTVEQFRLALPGAGTYTLTVSAPAVPGTGRPYTNRQGYALVASYAACTSAVTAAPTGLAAAQRSPMGVDLSWASAGGSTVTQVYRAPGTCAAPAGEFQYIGQSSGTTFADTRAQGAISYAYKLRGADGCGEGPLSSCVTITPTGVCDLVPPFGGLGSIDAGVPSGTHCRLRLNWTQAPSSCPAGPAVTYNVYRSTSPSFTPAPGNRVASVSSTSLYDDTDFSGVVSGTTYHYVVRAEDSTTAGSGPHGGNEEPNSARLFATALGAPGSPGTFADPAGDGNAYANPETPWRITSAQAHAGTFSYHPGLDVGNYPANACAAITTPALSLGAGAALSYWTRYNIEDQWDGVVVEISANGGPWTDLPPTTPAGYPSSLSQTQGNGCGYPASQGAFNGPVGNAGLTAWTQYQTSLGAFAGQSVRLRWRFTSDGGAEFSGFYLDDIQVTNVNLAGACSPTPVELQSISVR